MTSHVPTRYEVRPTCYDYATNSDRDVWCLKVELSDSRHDRWAVRHLSKRLSRSGEWDYEPIPSDRSPKWIKAHSFTLGEALDAASQKVDFMIVNGRTLLEVSGVVSER